jgi:hypothetical protein
MAIEDIASFSPGRSPSGDIGRRLLVTLGALVLLRLGRQIPLPGLDFSGATQMSRDLLLRVSIFGFGVTPIFSILFVVEIAKLAFPAIGDRQARDARFADRLRRLVLALAVVLAASEGVAFAHALENIAGLVPDPGWTFDLSVAATLAAATAFLGWLADRVTRHGLGDGFWLLLVATPLAGLPAAIAGMLELLRLGVIGPGAIFCAFAYFALAGALIVALAIARGRREGGFGLGFVDVWPPLLAEYLGSYALSALLYLLPGFALTSASIGIGSPLRLFVTAILILGFNLMRASPTGGDARGRPIGVIALAQIAVCCGGQALTRGLGLPFQLDGAWLIVVVATAIGVLASLRGAARTGQAGRIGT